MSTNDMKGDNMRSNTMSANIENKELSDLLGKTDIRIPRIQRDYAQGRQQEAVQKIRRSFVTDLVSVIKGEREGLNLDFVYGSYEGTGNSRAFEPLDGQQRLTTLYLLHWLLGKDFDYGFTYATRPTSSDFFLWMKSQIKVDELIKEWITDRGEEHFSETVKNQENYRWQWQFDPTIQSVLTMLDQMTELLGKDWLSEPHQQALENLSKITFEYLDLKDLGLSESLYVKMNARGKQLSDFDILKSTLEQDILRQMTQAKDEARKEQLLAVQKRWRQKIDTEWVDALWFAYAKEQIKSTTLNEDAHSQENRRKRKDIATNIEDWLHRLLLVFISRHLFLDECPAISDQAYNRKVNEMTQTLDVYLQTHIAKDTSTKDKSESSMCDIDYSLLMDDIDTVLSFANIDDTLKPVILALPPSSYIDRDGWSYLDYLTAWDRGIDMVAILHAIILWLKVNPIPRSQVNSDISQWKDDFVDWTRFARNILSNDNNYNRLDSIANLREALKGINAVIDNHFTSKADEERYRSVVERIALMPQATQGVYLGLDNSSINEEIVKAKMKVADDKWKSLITKAEDQPYVWGQIRWLLKWARTETETDNAVDPVRFEDYSERFEKVRALGTNGETAPLFRAAMLVMGYEDLGQTDYRTFIFSNHRDNSMKRYLRFSPSIYGDRFKRLIDLWNQSDPESDVASFCNYLINNPQPQWPLWLKAVCLHPEVTIEEVWDYIIHIERGHTCLQRKKTAYSGYNDPVLKHLRKNFERRFSEDIKNGKIRVRYFDSRQETPNRVEMFDRNPETGAESLRLAVYWGDGDNEYLLETGDTTRLLTEDELLQVSFL